MNAGRELDALVAEKVMGWTNVRFICHGLSLRGEVDGEPSEKVPFYSVDIDAAWDVVEKIGTSFTLERYNRWYVEFGDRYSAAADTAPHAICLAALKAVGVEVPE